MSSFRWYLLRVGLPIGVLIGVGQMLDAGAWWDLVIAAAASAIVLAALLAITTENFVRRVRRTWINVVLVVVITVAVTAVGGCALMTGVSWLPHGQWTRLPDPLRVASGFAGPSRYRMMGSDDGVLVMAARDGGYLVYDLHRRSWTLGSVIPGEILQRAMEQGPTQSGGATPLSPRGVVARARIDDIGADCSVRRHYILKQDHTVWEWSTGGCSIAWFGEVVLFLVVTILIGAIVGIARLYSKALPPWLEDEQ